MAARPRIELVVAAARNGVIGRDNGLPWRLPDDLKRFKALTIGHPILMGRKTFASIGKPLPGRKNIVLTRDEAFDAPGVSAVRSWDDALAEADGATLMVIGGAEIYRLALPVADRIHLTEVYANLDGDAHFPTIDPRTWREVAREAHPIDERHALGMAFVTLDRVSGTS